MTVREIDQLWIYDTYTCQASNAVNTSQFSVELRRAGMYLRIDVFTVAVIAF